jgi:fatty-acyl-CoA synthase
MGCRPRFTAADVSVMGNFHLPTNAANFVPLTPLSLLRRTADAHPERIAVRHGNLTRTYVEFAHRCTQLAAALAHSGVERGDVVSIMAPNTPPHLEAHFGVPMAGGILHSINYRLDPANIAFMLEHGRSRLLLVDDEFLALAHQAVERLARPIPLVRISDKQIPAAVSNAPEYEEFLASGNPEFRPLSPSDEWDSLALNYTSGTTGNPKGVVYHHRGAYLNAVGNVMAWGMTGHPYHSYVRRTYRAITRA